MFCSLSLSIQAGARAQLRTPPIVRLLAKSNKAYVHYSVHRLRGCLDLLGFYKKNLVLAIANKNWFLKKLCVNV
jgi:hypothetical protein